MLAAACSLTRSLLVTLLTFLYHNICMGKINERELELEMIIYNVNCLCATDMRKLYTNRSREMI